MMIPPVLVLASIGAVRPVFLIVMGICLMIFIWRLASGATDWAARLMVAGSLLLGFGYSVMLPLYEAGIIEPLTSRILLENPSTALAWHAVKLAVMNGGWLVLGTGLAMHAGVLPSPATRKVTSPRPQALSQPEVAPAPAHESAA